MIWALGLRVMPSKCLLNITTLIIFTWIFDAVATASAQSVPEKISTDGTEAPNKILLEENLEASSDEPNLAQENDDSLLVPRGKLKNQIKEDQESVDFPVDI